MKIYISYTHLDKEQAALIADKLKEAGHDVTFDSWNIKHGDNLIKKISRTIKSADALILLLSRNSEQSKWVMHEFSAIAFNDLSSQEQRIIPVLIDKVAIPSYLSQYMYIDLYSDHEHGIRKLIEFFEKDRNEVTQQSSKEIHREQQAKTRENKIIELAKALHDGRLTLVSGSGVTVDAGVPSWNDLLLQLLGTMITRMSTDHALPMSGADANKFHSRYSPSSLVVGTYLKINLGNDFLKELRDALYCSNPQSSDLLDAIVDLSRPQRDGKPLDSIITFNFDALLEENLEKQNIAHRAIYGEGVRNSPNELPVYHVHGFLPRKGPIPENMEVVFSEDAYHNQFIDPFSWSNLIQLNKLGQNTCLFIGLSLTDPNLRRLLDVAIRKNPEKTLNHFIIKKTPSNTQSEATMDKLALLLEEQDANELGLSVIWVDEFHEIPVILNSIAIKSGSTQKS
ncbi:TIR domain-containing protein [Desulfosediminicola flagellatus]|uniref:TIR domain-containing protein n=1 Tax=Desulfosediminicola flagellatus TaxID=2569541 RepID=UPI0010AD9513|nr:TIR domain-containing protein [Desulfosediminicola flagellatus]